MEYDPYSTDTTLHEGGVVKPRTKKDEIEDLKRVLAMCRGKINAAKAVLDEAVNLSAQASERLARLLEEE